TATLNLRLREEINPAAYNKKELTFRGTLFREGDKVMQIRNNYDLVWNKGREHGEGIFNGDIGRITRVDTREEYFIIDFDGRVCDYAFELADDLELAYAVTVHKSQGSEYPAVIIPLLQCPSPLMTRNLLYTAVTRAKSLLIAVGDAHVMRIMTENDKKALRFTALPYFFRQYETKTEDVL
ncbi:MAG: ATP-binding domain-containing protein, partial [Clostridia bacterium]|nr:ATP-binding domain-containing protein [Clostridia bacterium]